MPTALVVGASRGLGRALAQEYLDRGWEVIATARQPEALDALIGERLTRERLDVTDWSGIDALRDRLAARPLDLLFVNAGIALPGPIGETAPEAFTELMLTNVLAPLRIIDTLDPLVAPEATVVAMTSLLGSIGENRSAGTEAYRISKAGLNMGLVSLARRRADRRTYLLMHPGWVRTDMGGPNATLTIAQSVPSLVDAVAARQGSGGVAFIDYRGQELPW